MKLLPIRNLCEVTAERLKNGHSSITECSDGIFKILSRNLILLIVAQYCYVRFSNNEREHFRLQINSWLGAISFDKAFSKWFNFTANFFISEEKVWVIKLYNHYFISASKRNVNNFFSLLIYLKHLKKNQQKNGKLRCLLNYFHEYAILLHPNFSVMSVDRASPLSVKRSEGRVGGGSTISDKWGNHLPCQPTIAAQLLGNGGKIINVFGLQCSMFCAAPFSKLSKRFKTFHNTHTRKNQ
jgi:hypothetical protein